MKFEKVLISVIFFFIFNNPLSNELQNQSYSLFFENPSFVFSLENQKVQIDGKNSQILDKNIYLIKNPVVLIRRADALLDIDSSKAMYFKDSKKIEFLDSVNFNIFNDENSLNIKGEELILEIEKGTISSEKKSETIFDDIKVNSIRMNLIFVREGYNADFAQADIQIKNKETEHKGFANKISMISKENELIMKGNAYLNRDGFDISADLIHYNFKSNKIIRSINSTIQSDS